MQLVENSSCMSVDDMLEYRYELEIVSPNKKEEQMITTLIILNLGILILTGSILYKDFKNKTHKLD